MASPFTEMTQILLRRQIWGPFLILVGAYLLFGVGTSRPTAGDQFVAYVPAILAALLMLGGIMMMFLQLRSDESRYVSSEPERVTSEPEYVMAELSKNYELLRRQTTQGFVLSGVFMALGLLVILSGSAGEMFGFTKEGSNLTTVAGVIMEFVSATALLIYRLNFNRLNESTDKIDNAWRILTAHTLSKSLPDDKLRSDATMKLIDALLAAPQKNLTKAAQPGAATDGQRAARG